MLLDVLVQAGTRLLCATTFVELSLLIGSQGLVILRSRQMMYILSRIRLTAPFQARRPRLRSSLHLAAVSPAGIHGKYRGLLVAITETFVLRN